MNTAPTLLLAKRRCGLARCRRVAAVLCGMALASSVLSSCSLLSKIGLGRAGGEPTVSAQKEGSEEARRAFELARMLHGSAETKRMMSEPVARRFPGGGQEELAGIGRNLAEASRMYGESIKGLSKLNPTAVRTAFAEIEKGLGGPKDETRVQILDLVISHESRLRGGLPLLASDWERDFRTLHYLRPASEDPAARRASRILLGE